MSDWYVQFRGDAHPLSIYPDEDNWKSARLFVLKWLGVDRLPHGTEIYN